MKILSIITPIITLLFYYMLPQKHINMQIRFSLYCIYRPVVLYILYIMRKPIYGHFTHILQKEKWYIKWYIKSFCYNIVENHLYTKFGKKKNVLVI